MKKLTKKFTCVSVLIPTSSEVLPFKTISSLFCQICDKIEVIVVRNGCKQRIQKEIFLDYIIPKNISFRILDIPRKGKAHALNIGIKLSTYDLIAVVDADCELASDAIDSALRFFDKPYVMAVGGTIKVRKNNIVLQKLQSLEYEKTFNLSRKLFHCINSDCLISGAFGIFRKDVLTLVHGYREDTVGEDMDIVLRIQSKFYKKSENVIAYAQNAVCFTDTPKSLIRLLHQRDRWQRGLLDSLIYNREIIGNPHYLSLGLIGLPYQLLFELLSPFFMIMMFLIFIISFFVSKDVSFFAFLLKIWSNISLIYFFVEVLTGLVADYIGGTFIEDSNHWVFKIVLLTFFSCLLQIIISFARAYGMITYHWRKLVW